MRVLDRREHPQARLWRSQAMAELGPKPKGPTLAAIACVAIAFAVCASFPAPAHDPSDCEVPDGYELVRKQAATLDDRLLRAQYDELARPTLGVIQTPAWQERESCDEIGTRLGECVAARHFGTACDTRYLFRTRGGRHTFGTEGVLLMPHRCNIAGGLVESRIAVDRVLESVGIERSD